MPPPDQTPPDELVPRRPSDSSPVVSTQNLNKLTVPLGNRTQSVASDHSNGSTLPSPVSGGPARTSSPFKPRGKALAAVLGGSSRNSSSTDIAQPREVNLPQDPFVNGQPLEVFLYKNATECPICFLTYPPYLNHTRCCDQPICSECFVQIKRPDPHYPEGHNESDPNPNTEETGLLVSEPACCPYCTQPDFGVTYEPPPFRRGLAYAFSPPGVGSISTAMSSSSSLNTSALSPPPGGNRRRTQSLSANAPNVILTDKIRPDWSTKLQTARNHQARRAAAATALHNAAFLMSPTETSRPFRVSRFGRRNTASSGTATPGGTLNPASLSSYRDNGGSGSATPVPAGLEPGPRGSSGRGMLLTGSRAGTDGRSRMEDLEDMMLMEAIRLSLVAEEERQRKVDKEQKKEAKRREKEARKKAKAAAKHGGPYEVGEGRSGHSSASGSNLSLPSLSFGRKRGNSGASNLRVEASVANAVASSANTSGPVSPVAESVSSNTKDKGKAVDRSLPSTPEGSSSQEDGGDDPMAASSSTITPSATSNPRPIPSPHQPVGPSHLRQMSSASSITSSLGDSQAGSYTTPSHLHDPKASGLSLAGRSREEDGDQDPSASTEPMFNFRSLAEVVGVTLEGENAGRRLSRIEAEKKAKESSEKLPTDDGASAASSSKGEEAKEERVEDVAGDASHPLPNLTIPQPPVAKDGNVTMSALAPPEVMITPETPALEDDGVGGESKQLGFEGTKVEPMHQMTQ